jgi:gamma-glutamyltranspeptidase/glutathione hydrolase
MVVTGHPEATDAGHAVLATSGSVVDAAIAAAAVLTVALPQACTLGGDAFVLYHDANAKRTYGLNAAGRSPAAVRPENFASGIPARGPLSVTMPGVVGGWFALHQRFGQLTWQSLFDRAIELCDSGLPVFPGLARSSAAYHAELAMDPGSAETFLPQGAPLTAGALFRQGALGQTLRIVAADGADGFYGGKPAEQLSRYLAARGGLLEVSDFRGYRPQWVEPIETSFRGYRAKVMPPNSFGLYMLLQLNVLSDIEPKRISDDLTERLATLIRAARVAFAIGDRAVADPAFGPEPVAEILGPPGHKRLREAFSASAGVSPPNQGGTAVVSVADADGNATIIVQSVFQVFGSAVTDPESGIVLNDRMTGFTTIPGHPNQVGPCKLPAHTLNPVLVLNDDRIKYVIGTPGGPGQTLTLTQVLQSAIDRKLDLAAAIAEPRWSMDFASAAIVESSMPVELIEGVKRRGLQVSASPPNAPFFGSVEAIEFQADGSLRGVVDDRREASARGV